MTILFLVNNPATWASSEVLYNAFRAWAICNCVIATTKNNFIFGDSEESTYRFFQQRGLDAIRLNGNSEENRQKIDNIGPNLIFRQSPWDQDFPEECSTASLSVFKTGYVSYFGIESVSSHDDSNVDFHHMQPYHEGCTVIFANSKEDAELFRRATKHEGRRRFIFEAGSLKMLGMVPPSKHAYNGTRKTVLYAPHHSVGDSWLNFGTFLKNSGEILDWMDRHGEYDYVFRPHPSLEAQLASGTSREVQEEYSTWKSKFLGKKGRVLGETLNYAETLQMVDLVVTDGINILFEAQLFQKPILFLERSDHRPFHSRAEERLNGVYRFPSENLAPALRLAEILLLDHRKHFKRKIQQVNRRKFIGRKPNLQVLLILLAFFTGKMG